MHQFISFSRINSSLTSTFKYLSWFLFFSLDLCCKHATPCMLQIWITDWPQQIKCADKLKYGQIHTPADYLVHLLTIYFQPKLGDAEPSPFGHTCVCQCCTSPGLSTRWKTHSALGQAEEVQKGRTKTHSVQTCNVTKTNSAVWSKTKPLSLSLSHTHTHKMVTESTTGSVLITDAKVLSIIGDIYSYWLKWLINCLTTPVLIQCSSQRVS